MTDQPFQEPQYLVIHPLGPIEEGGLRRGRVKEILGGIQGGLITVDSVVFYSGGAGLDPNEDHVILSDEVVARVTPGDDDA
jgi:hypothetical protein